MTDQLYYTLGVACALFHAYRGERQRRYLLATTKNKFLTRNLCADLTECIVVLIFWPVWYVALVLHTTGVFKAIRAAQGR